MTSPSSAWSYRELDENSGLRLERRMIQAVETRMHGSAKKHRIYRARVTTVGTKVKAGVVPMAPFEN